MVVNELETIEPLQPIIAYIILSKKDDGKYKLYNSFNSDDLLLPADVVEKPHRYHELKVKIKASYCMERIFVSNVFEGMTTFRAAENYIKNNNLRQDEAFIASCEIAKGSTIIIGKNNLIGFQNLTITGTHLDAHYQPSKFDVLDALLSDNDGINEEDDEDRPKRSTNDFSKTDKIMSDISETSKSICNLLNECIDDIDAMKWTGKRMPTAKNPIISDTETSIDKLVERMGPDTVIKMNRMLNTIYNG